MSLESPGVLSHLTSWLTSCELHLMRTLSCNLYAAIPRLTWELIVCKFSTSESIRHLSTVFPNVWCLRVQDALLDEMPTPNLLVSWLDKYWKLRELMLTRVTCISVFNVHLLAEELTKVAIRECYQLEQVLVDPTDLPSLHQLDLSSCAQLVRVHVTSKVLENLDLSCNDNLQYLVLDLERVVDLDLSFLKSLTYLCIRSSSLRRLNLRGYNHLTPNTMSINCPNLQFVVVQGTSILVEDLNKTEFSDKMFLLPDTA
ncbi:unnamed protein product [Peronospora destructor]|uniref:Uncharacterized protein n=1 Tax=Peronospora destructor TaxID=86335 RepID=A0AAV0U3X4_9STRA|nr:unnamed protein product [Peronospora destructor]